MNQFDPITPETEPGAVSSKFFSFVSLCLSGKNPFLFWLSALVIFSPLCFLGISHPLWRTADARFVELAREMYLSHNYAVPHLNDQPYLEKPPLFYAATALAFVVTGRVSETLARIPTALFALLGALAAVGIGARLRDRRFGLLLGLIMATTLQYQARSHTAYLDVMLTAAVNLSLLCFLRVYEPGKKSYSFEGLVLFYLLLILAFYIKGLVGLAVPVLCVTTFLIWSEGPWSVWRLRPFTGIFLFLLLTLPWHLALFQQGGLDYFKIFYLDNHLYRFLSSGGPDLGHREPWFWYLRTTWEFFEPWSLLFVPAGYALFRREFRDRLGPSAWKFLVAWLVPAFILFSIASTKREDYLLPLYSALAGAVAGWIIFRQDPKAAPRWEQAFIGAFGLAVAGAGLALPVYCYVQGAPRASLYLLVGLVPAAAATWHALFHSPRMVWATVMFNVWVLVLEGAVYYLPVENRDSDHSAFARKVAELTRDAPVLYCLNPTESERGIIPFYTGKFLKDPAAIENLQDLAAGPAPLYLVQLNRTAAQLEKKEGELKEKGVDKEELLKAAVTAKNSCVLWRLRPGKT
jgi:4-amino-4-deoxy-L-arabinose transferase-like glycosyltransferase